MNERIYIVIPAFNEAKVIGEVLQSLKVHYSNIVVVDDASQDETRTIAEKEGAIVIHHLLNRGQGAALATGIQYALRQDADIIVTFDADNQHKLEDIHKLVQPILEKEVDVVLGSRFLEKDSAKNLSLLRKTILKAALIFTKITSGLQITDTHNGLRAFSRYAAETIKIKQNRMAHASEILDEIQKHKFRYKEVPVTIEYSSYSFEKGQSSFAFAKILFKYMLGKLME